MKRHDALIPLSHDHHHALVLALRLKKGGPASANDNWPTEPDTQRIALLAFVEGELYSHFAVEEEVIFPACFASDDDEIKTLAKTLAHEHEAMRTVINDLRTCELPSLREKMREFGTMLEAHVRKEERSFFPLVEEGVRANTLKVDTAALAAKLQLYRTPPACGV